MFPVLNFLLNSRMELERIRAPASFLVYLVIRVEAGRTNLNGGALIFYLLKDNLQKNGCNSLAWFIAKGGRGIPYFRLFNYSFNFKFS